jgi:cyclic-di-GMP-binding protein
MKLDLPPTGTEQPPLFVDLDQFEAWKKTLLLSNPLQTQAQLLRQLHLLNRYTLAADLRLAMLEGLREPLYFVQGESAKKFSGKPLPLAPPEQAALDSAHGLWQALGMGYLRCLEACLAGAPAVLPQAALICQRALTAFGADQFDQVRAGNQPDAAHWQSLHTLYAAAETLAVTDHPVDDAQRASQPLSPAATYVELMLLAAGNLHELLPRQQVWVARWARRWAGKVVVLPAPPAESPALPLCVDLAGAAPAVFKPQTGAGARWLDTTELRKSLKSRLTRLAKGDPEDTPARLGLGDDCPQPACGEVLRRIYPRWVKGGVLRRHERHPMSGPSRLVAGVDAIHYYLSGREPFKSPTPAKAEDLRRQREELAVFGRVAARFEDEYSRDHGYQLESWQAVEDWGMLDQSSGGLRLVRPLKQAGGRLGIGQLVAVQPAGSNGMLLAMVRWAQVVDEHLAAGIALMPGKPQAVAVRSTGVMASNEAYRPAFLLPALAALGQPACAVLPPGSFKPGRIMEAWTPSAAWRIRLKEILERGADFDRASFEEVP